MCILVHNAMNLGTSTCHETIVALKAAPPNISSTPVTTSAVVRTLNMISTLLASFKRDTVL